MGLTIEDFIGGWIGGICGLIVGHPLDTIKVRQQTYATSMVTSIRQTFRYEGLRGFYKGALFPFLAIGPSNAIFFGTYGNVINWMSQREKHSHTAVSYRNMGEMERIFVAGFAAGTVQVVFNCPVEVIKINLQARTDTKGSWKKHYQVNYNGSFEALQGIFKDQGIKGFYRGFLPMFIRDVPTSGIYTLAYELLMYANFSQCNTPELLKQMIAGGLAGVISWIPVIPVDVVKSRMQVEDPNDPNFRNFGTAFMHLLRTRGVRVFLRGVEPLILQAFVRNAAVFIGYETFLSFA